MSEHDRRIVRATRLAPGAPWRSGEMRNERAYLGPDAAAASVPERRPRQPYLVDHLPIALDSQMRQDRYVSIICPRTHLVLGWLLPL